jgi:hypothetical protein
MPKLSYFGGQRGWSAFKTRLAEKHYPHYLDFRSVAGADYDTEAWFDNVLSQNRRR